MRAVAREVGVTQTAAIHYFADKTALVQAVLDRRADPLGDEVRARLSTLVEGEEEPRVRDLVEAVVRPIVAILEADPEGGLAWMKLFTGLALAEDPLWLSGVGREPSIADLFAKVLARALPDVDPDDLYSRTGIAMYSMLSALAGVDLAGYGHPLSRRGLSPRFVDQLVLFTSAGLTADQARDRTAHHS